LHKSNRNVAYIMNYRSKQQHTKGKQQNLYSIHKKHKTIHLYKITTLYRLLVCCYVLYQTVTDILQQGMAICSLHYQHVQTKDALYQLINYDSRNNEYKKIKNTKTNNT
jgi:hypothetical protein